jgi:hypothetical protein
MESRGKRAKSVPPPAANQRRRIVDNSQREKLLRELIIERITYNNTDGYLRSRFPGKSQLLVEGEWWAKFSQDNSKIPSYILETMYDPKYSADPLSEYQNGSWSTNTSVETTVSLSRKSPTKVLFFCRHHRVRAKWPSLRSDERPWEGMR